MDQNRLLTKKEMKQMRKLEKLDQAKDKGRQNTIKWIVIGISSILFLAFFSFLVFLAKSSNSKPAVLSDLGQAKGPQNAKITLVEFADFQCPACKAYHPIIKEILSAYDGRIKFVYKHFPLTSIHANATPAAKAAEAAGQQGKFFKMHDLLYDKQSEWSELPGGQAKDKFISYAEALNIDLEKFNKDYDRNDLEEKITKNQEEGINNGVNATPTFFLNGKKIENPRTIEDFKKIIDQELK